jgi:hypothetical protein
MDAEERKMAGASDHGQAAKGGRFLGSLRDALAAAGRDETGEAQHAARTVIVPPATKVDAQAPVGEVPVPEVAQAVATAAEHPVAPPPLPSAAEVAREARASQTRTAVAKPQPAEDRHVEFEALPTTRVVRGGKPAAAAAAAATEDEDEPVRTQLVRGHAKVVREGFQQDPVVGWLVIVGGPGLGMFRPIFEGNNTVGRNASQRIPIDFGDTSISSEEQAYIRYDSVDRSFLFVPNLAKTNVVRVNDSKPTAAVSLSAMDVITMGRTQLVFVPFCGPEFDWSELSEAKG